MKEFLHACVIISSMIYTTSYIFSIIYIMIYFINYNNEYEFNWISFVCCTIAFIPCLYITILYYFHRHDKDFNLEDHLIEK